MDPGWRNEEIFDIIKKHPGKNQQEIIGISGINKEPARDSLKTLEQKKKIESARIGGGELVYFVRLTEKIPSFQENVKIMQEDFGIMKVIVLKSLELVQNRSSKEITAICVNGIDALYSYKNVLEFVIASNTFKGNPMVWNELKNEVEQFVNEVSKSIVGNDLHAKIIEHFSDKHTDSLRELGWFLKSVQSEKKKLKSNQKSIENQSN